MSTLLFEGEDLGVLRERVRREAGAGARIVRAGRVRRGGIAGFFGRESYQLEVEPDGAGGAPARPVPSTPEEQADSVDDPVLVDFAAAAGFDEQLAAATGASTVLTASRSRPERTSPDRREREPEPVVADPEALGALTGGVGTLVAVVGERPEVTATATEVAGSLGGAEVRALPLPGPPDADLTRAQVLRPLTALLRRRLRGLPAVMVVPVRRWGADLDQVELALRALRPDFVLAVVAASSKPEDVSAWCDGLGGADALAVVGAPLTTTPGTCLDAGVPIASIDGRSLDRGGLVALLAAPGRG